MERRASRRPVEHERAGGKIGPEGKLFKSKHAPRDETNEDDDEVHRKSKGEKQKRKRKREDSNAVSRKRHTQRVASKDRYSGSRKSSKQKTKQRFSRWKSRRGSDNGHSSYDSSDSSMSIRRSVDSSYSGSRKKGRSKNGSGVHSEVDQVDATCAKDNRKKESKTEGIDRITFKSSKGDENEAQLHGSTAKIIREKSFEMVTWVGVEGQHNEITDGQGSRAVGQVKQHVGIDTAGEEAALGYAATKAEHLEIELRQRALANLRKHRNIICEEKEHKEMADSTMLMKDIKKGEVVVAEVMARQNEQSDLKGGKELACGHGIDVDEDRWPLASDTSPEPHKNMVEQSTSKSLMPVKPFALGESLIETESTVEKEKISEGNLVQLTSISHLKVSHLPLENEIQPERENNSRIVESSKNRDLYPDVVVSGEANTVVMANGNSEPGESGDLQAEAKGSFGTRDIISRNAVQRLESMNFIYDELHSKVGQELKGMRDIGERFSARDSQVDADLPISQNDLETNSGNIVEARAATSVDQESQSEKVPISLTNDCGRVTSPCGPKSEIATGKQEDVASMFQQKTMSVMRGGELVQVNYKVYIPKRAAELAKRRLQR